MEQKLNLQLQFPVGNYTVICGHCGLVERCPLAKQHVPIVDIVRLDGDIYAMEAVCQCDATWDEGDAFGLYTLREMIRERRDADNE